MRGCELPLGSRQAIPSGASNGHRCLLLAGKRLGALQRRAVTRTAGEIGLVSAFGGGSSFRYKAVFCIHRGPCHLNGVCANLTVCAEAIVHFRGTDAKVNCGC
jgi:hypothetical protein